MGLGSTHTCQIIQKIEARPFVRILVLQSIQSLSSHKSVNYLKRQIRPDKSLNMFSQDDPNSWLDNLIASCRARVDLNMYREYLKALLQHDITRQVTVYATAKIVLEELRATPEGNLPPLISALESLSLGFTKGQRDNVKGEVKNVFKNEQPSDVQDLFKLLTSVKHRLRSPDFILPIGVEIALLLFSDPSPRLQDYANQLHYEKHNSMTELEYLLGELPYSSSLEMLSGITRIFSRVPGDNRPNFVSKLREKYRVYCPSQYRKAIQNYAGTTKITSNDDALELQAHLRGVEDNVKFENRQPSIGIRVGLCICSNEIGEQPKP